MSNNYGNTVDVGLQMHAGSISETVSEATKEIMAQLETDLYGAWRAGFDYYHVYHPTAPVDLDETYTVTQAGFPSYSEKPPKDPGEFHYAHTYVLNDDLMECALEIRRHRGEQDGSSDE